MNTERLAETSLSGPAQACYEELSPREFSRRGDLVVLLMHAEHARGHFAGFRQVICVDDPRDLPALLRTLEPGQPLGLVCPGGDCTSRLAIRVSKSGFPVYHLSGGLREWYHCFRTVHAS